MSKVGTLPAFISTRCNQQPVCFHFGDMAGQTDSEFRALAITETSRNLVCSFWGCFWCVVRFRFRSEFSFGWHQSSKHLQKWRVLFTTVNSDKLDHTTGIPYVKQLDLPDQSPAYIICFKRWVSSI